MDFQQQRKQLLEEQLSSLKLGEEATVNLTEEIMISGEKQKIFAEQNLFDYYDKLETFLDKFTLDYSKLNDTKEINKYKNLMVLPFEENNQKVLAILGPTSQLSAFEFDKMIVVTRDIYNYFVNQMKGDIISTNGEEEVSFKEQLLKLLETSVMYNAPDIHLFPIDFTAYTITMRTEIGISTIADRIPFQMGLGIINAVKNNIGIDTSIQIIEAKGKMEENIMNERRFFRVSIMSSTKGESVNIRQLATKDSIKDLKNLSYDDMTIKEIENLMDYREGVILVTGATGSGKSMLLYTILNKLAKYKAKRILTIENPVEIDMSAEKIIQNDLSETETAKEEFRASTKKLKKAFLRHDPDVTLIQEVRDKEETEALFEMAIEGHMALSTLHANSVSATLVRLQKYLGIHKETIQSAVRGVINQQLAPRKCTMCNGMGYKDQQMQELCQNCNGIGLKGKVPIYELAVFGEVEEGVDVEDLENATRFYLSKLDCIKIQYSKNYLTYKVMVQLVKQVIKNNQSFEEVIMEIEDYKENGGELKEGLSTEVIDNIVLTPEEIAELEEFEREVAIEEMINNFDNEVEASKQIKEEELEMLEEMIPNEYLEDFSNYFEKETMILEMARAGLSEEEYKEIEEEIEEAREKREGK